MIPVADVALILSERSDEPMHLTGVITTRRRFRQTWTEVRVALHNYRMEKVLARDTHGGDIGPGERSVWAPRARLERATYCLGGTTAPTLCRPVTTHVTSERNS